MRVGVASRERLYELGVFGFVFCGLALSGIPGWSRLVFLFITLLSALTIADIALGRIALGKWLVLPITFVLVALLEGFIRYPASHDAIVRLLGTWSGCLLVGDAIRRGTHVRVAINAMFFASFANAAAALLGFDSYFSYVATAEQQSYASILDRRSGLVGNANLLAVQAILPLFAALVWSRGLSKVLVVCGAVCAIYAMFATGSRKLILLAAFLVVALWVRVPGVRRRILLTVAGVSAVGVVVLVWGSGSTTELEGASRDVLAIERIYQAVDGQDSSFVIRKWMIGAAQDLFVASPVFGHGLGYFADNGGFGAYAHNNFWELAAAGGLVLVISYYAMPLLALLRLIPNALKGNAESGAACVLIFALLANDYGMVAYDEKIVVLIIVLLLVWTTTRNGRGMEKSLAGARGDGEQRQ